MAGARTVCPCCKDPRHTLVECGRIYPCFGDCGSPCMLMQAKTAIRPTIATATTLMSRVVRTCVHMEMAKAQPTRTSFLMYEAVL